MKRSSVGLVLGIIFSSIGGVVIEAQVGKIERTQFLSLLEASRKATNNVSVRETTVIESSQFPDYGWQPYSSWIRESAFPDSSYLSYKTGRTGDYICVGKVLFTRTSHDLKWERSEDDGTKWTYYLGNPASVPGFNGTEDLEYDPDIRIVAPID